MKCSRGIMDAIIAQVKMLQIEPIILINKIPKRNIKVRSEDKNPLISGEDISPIYTGNIVKLNPSETPVINLIANSIHTSFAKASQIFPKNAIGAAMRIDFFLPRVSPT
uniref:Uncharacterized protein LOC114338807 n=1 Tax=Diabrotica virgifera virgifera TaxID=50390 RepID=A0A6P7GH72_DIAVI